MANPAEKFANEIDIDESAPSAQAAPRPRRPHLYVASADKTDDDTMLGQFIPIHYHYQMLGQEPRIGGFEQAIAAVVKPGMKVLELGAGTGVLSYFAARAGAAKVYAVERIPHVAQAARRFAMKNGVADRVEVVVADATAYLPPEPVDVVVCEMLHTAMLREKQLEVIASFKERYLARFGGPLPRFVPEAAIMAVQPVQVDFVFHGYEAAVPMFLDGSGNGGRVARLAEPALYSMFQYDADYASHFRVDHCAAIETGGTLNALRFITKNVLAILEEEGRSIDWDMHDLIVPVASPLKVRVGDVVRIRFRYDAGDSLLALADSIDGEDVD